jgi:hypothetical protein
MEVIQKTECVDGWSLPYVQYLECRFLALSANRIEVAFSFLRMDPFSRPEVETRRATARFMVVTGAYRFTSLPIADP